jgi:hypothetical protein
VHWVLDEGARGAKSWCKKSNSQCAVGLLSTALFPGSFQIKSVGRMPVDIERPDSRHRLPVGCWLSVPSGNATTTTGLHLRRWPR